MTGEKSDASTKPSSARSVDRALALLIAVSESGKLSLSEASRKTDLPASTALRLLRTLEKWELIARGADSDFRTGPRLVQLSALTLSKDAVVRVAKPSLERIASATRESAYVSAIGPGESVLYLAQEEGTHPIRHANWVGRTVPLEGTAAGEALVGKIGEIGYAVRSHTVEPDVTAIAAPVFDGHGDICAALSVVGPTFRLGGEAADRVGALLANEAAEISRGLGYKTTPIQDER